MYRTDFWTLWEKARVGCSERTALKQVYYQVWNRSPAQIGCMRQVLRAGALGRPRGMGWGGRPEGGSGWGTHVNPWLIHVNVWQKPLQYCKVISLQLIKINGWGEEKQSYIFFCVFKYILAQFIYFFTLRLCSIWDLISLTSGPMHPAMEAWSLNHSTTREVPDLCTFVLGWMKNGHSWRDMTG